MAYSPIEESYMNGFVTSQFPTPEPEPVLLAENKNISYPGEQFTDTGGGAAVGTRLKMPSGLNTPENIKKVGGEIIPAGAAMAKGAGQASVGMYGDIEGLGRMVLNYMGVDVNEKTKLPTTEEVKSFLDKYIPVDEKYSTFEKAGELASPAGAYGVGKGAIKAIKATKDMPVGLSIKMLDGTESVIEQAPKIETPAFKNWFGKSKVVDEAGKPRVLYHGTDQSFDTFEGTSWFTTSKSDASNYSNIITPDKEHTPNVMPVYVSIKKPKYLENYANRQEVEKAKASGKYDGVIVKSVMGSDKSYYITFKPEQVKSAIGNEGTFDPKNPSMVKGAVVTGGAGASQKEESK